MMWSGSYADTPGDIGPEEWEALLPHDPGCRCDECYATLQAEQLAAADLDPRWPSA